LFKYKTETKQSNTPKSHENPSGLEDSVLLALHILIPAKIIAIIKRALSARMSTEFCAQHEYLHLFGAVSTQSLTPNTTAIHISASALSTH
jgi:hypothetical protein